MEVRHEQQEYCRNGKQKSETETGDRLLKSGNLASHHDRRSFGRRRDAFESGFNLLLRVAQRDAMQVRGDTYDPLSTQAFDHLRHRAVLKAGYLVELGLRLAIAHQR